MLNGRVINCYHGCFGVVIKSALNLCWEMYVICLFFSLSVSVLLFYYDYYLSRNYVAMILDLENVTCSFYGIKKQPCILIH